MFKRLFKKKKPEKREIPEEIRENLATAFVADIKKAFIKYNACMKHYKELYKVSQEWDVSTDSDDTESWHT